MSSDTGECARIRDMIEAQAKIYCRAKLNYDLKEAERKTFESRLVIAAFGKSHAERLTNAQATDEWLEFHKELATLESKSDFEHFKFELLEKMWLEQYSKEKMNDGHIKRYGA